jgi:hypothetical protein
MRIYPNNLFKNEMDSHLGVGATGWSPLQYVDHYMKTIFDLTC